MPIDELVENDVVDPVQDVTPGPQPLGAHPPRSRKVRLPISGNNLVLAAMFIGGVAAVYVLKLSVKPEKATAQERRAEQQVEAAIAQMGSSEAKAVGETTAATVVDTLHNDARDRQIPSWVMGRNPFVFKAPKKKKPVEATPVATPADTWTDNEVELAKARAMTAVKHLELQTTLIAAEPIAMISGRSLRKGQTIKGWTVAAIKSSGVVLTWQSEDEKHQLKYVLTMEER